MFTRTAFACLLAIASQSSTTGLSLMPPALMLSDNAGNSVSIAGSGSAGTPGDVTWAGTLGIFNVSVASGQTKPALSPPQITLSLRVTSGALGAGASAQTLTAKWSDVGFDGTGPVSMTASDSSSGSVTISYTGYIDSTDALFGTGTTVGTMSAGGTLSGPGPLSEPFSMTEVATITMGANSSYTLTSLNMMAAPVQPLTVACPSASGQLNVAYASYLVGGGGVPPYTFSSTGTLPIGLGLNPSTGELSGTPTEIGTFPFTAQIMDSSGNAPQNAAQTTCSIATTAPPTPLGLRCPDPIDNEGSPYSSSLVATGGVPPYSFSLTSGTLPPGLSLNSSTGAITGTDKTTTGTYSFTARVADASGKAGANQAVQVCQVVAQVATLNMVAAKGTTPQTAVVGQNLKTPLAVVVTDEKTGKPVQNVQVQFIAFSNNPGTFTGGKYFAYVQTDATGTATAPAFTSKKAGGPYKVRATATGAAQSVIFKITFTNDVASYIIVEAGMDQSALKGTKFQDPLQATVYDQYSNPVPNCPVVFSAPAMPNAGATFADTGTAKTNPIDTDANGSVTSPAITANATAGTYTISVTCGMVKPVGASMTNTGPPAKLVDMPVPGDPTISGGAHFATTGKKYSTLVVQVQDAAGRPIPGQAVQFRSTNPVSPAGPGATFPNGSILSKTTSDAEGNATAATLTANGKQGVFNVVVTVPGTAVSLTLTMKNIGQVSVPNVIGMTLQGATDALDLVYLGVGEVDEEASPTVPAGKVIAQDPQVDTMEDAGTEVNLVISTGK